MTEGKSTLFHPKFTIYGTSFKGDKYKVINAYSPPFRRFDRENEEGCRFGRQDID